MRLRDKTAVITGAGSGFGEGIAKRFVEEGAQVLVADINSPAAQRVAKEINAVACAVDVANDKSVQAMANFAIEAFGSIDILVNNAGVTHLNQPMLDVDEATFDQVYAVNVKSIYLTAKHIVPKLIETAGNIVNIASTAAISPRAGLTWYNGTKGAVVTLTKSMAIELAPHRVRVNAVNPVLGTTGLTARFMGGIDNSIIREKFISTIPLGRMSTPLDIANATLFLACHEADLVTGLCMEIDGGRCI
ncbi:MAG: 3-oxoacyl-ACP reductase [Rhodospirillaceae bacterium TMED8]|nr:3-oxoacyl-ACP reductase [Magnetovibrio sp.]OUT51224.1 MAG: 3-oxoacyl-ACP reductase [Rhodospirillaceae bacterium TMED8]